MRLATITPAGGNRESLVLGSVESAPFADARILIDSGESAQKAIELVKACCAPGTVHVAKYPGETFDCADARNFGFQVAAGLGFDWAMILDTDERIVSRVFDVRAYLESTDADVVHVFATERRYTKERFFRLPVSGRFEGRVHEEYCEPDPKHDLMPMVRFDEVPKSPEESAARDEMIEWKCRQWIAEEPKRARPRYHLGCSLLRRGDAKGALLAFCDYSDLTDSPHERAWGLLQCAVALDALTQYQNAIRACVDGMAEFPHFAEFPWWSAYQSLRLNDPVNALAWADMAIALGRTSSYKRVRPLRLGNQIPEAEYEGPWEWRRIACEVLGLSAEASEASDMVERARVMRIQDG